MEIENLAPMRILKLPYYAMTRFHRDSSSAVRRGLVRAMRLGATAATLLLVVHVSAQETTVTLATKTSAASPAVTTSNAPKKAASRPAPTKSVPKDVENQRGISPFWEKIVQGDTAAIAHDYTTASSYYQSALTTDPKNAIGHLRMAEVALKQNQLEKVPEYLDSAVRFSQENLNGKAQALFLTALMYEKKKMMDEAIAAWEKYKALSVAAEDAKKDLPEGTIPRPAVIFVATADARIAVLKKQKDLIASYAIVRQRIDKNVAAADEATGSAAAETKSR